ncbi:hypothetical protein [Hahella sp. KA22]|uniref:Nmad3 family putative nucleotide modification protein n=2 Tax=Hahella sp. KA22 TaxID=1628392 RepID=UPI0011AE7A76|nr:hypothetical protein [Hahella sp. KA22]
MRLILSRKGFDSSAGGISSLIMPDGRMISLPIPTNAKYQKLGMLNIEGVDIDRILKDLTDCRFNADTTVHIDPDLCATYMTRKEGWRSSFGQVSAAQSHLRNQKVACGDLFLFFGWFRQIANTEKGWRFAEGSADLHVLFGWLQIGEILQIGEDTEEVVRNRPWLSDHPHILAAENFKHSSNTIYVASEKLSIGGKETAFPGGGCFPRFEDILQLTQANVSSRSSWKLPGFFFPPDKKPTLTYHKNPTRWGEICDNYVSLQSVCRGQEFVYDCGEEPAAIEWLNKLFTEALRK